MQHAQGQADIKVIWPVEGEPPHVRRINPDAGPG
jgi:hypothetical protein